MTSIDNPYTTQHTRNTTSGSSMNATIFSASPIGVDAHLVEVEADISYGLVNFFIVGLPDAAIKESKKRIQTALKNSGIPVPARKITINLAPADLKKEGTLFDLPIAIGILQALGVLNISSDYLAETLFLGELSLDGSIRFIKGALSVAYDAHRLGKKRVIVPKENAPEASCIQNIEVLGVGHLTELIAHLRNERTLVPATYTPPAHSARDDALDFSQVKGQYQAKRALQIAAAGRHNILFVGPPGSGKTMLAKRLATIMPPMAFDEMLEASKIYSVTGKLRNKPLMSTRPFRSPHHSISQAGLIGGGSYPQPGEVSLSHHGILFLDELTEFKRETLEALRQPLENRQVSIARVHQTITFPASFLLVAALNPCPCGFLGDESRACTCSPNQIAKYLTKLSGPLLDRIDIQINVPSIAYETIVETAHNHTGSDELQEGVTRACSAQHSRFGSSVVSNSSMRPDQVEQSCTLTPDAQELLKKAFDRLRLSMRGYHKVLRVARTIADLAGCEIIEAAHIREAIMYRSLDTFIEQHRG